jgi:hypothetical protein
MAPALVGPALALPLLAWIAVTHAGSFEVVSWNAPISLRLPVAYLGDLLRPLALTIVALAELIKSV